MPTYIAYQKKASREEFQAWRDTGYTGTWTQYKTDKRLTKIDGPIFINGDLGPHCADCAAPSRFLCDYPVGDGLTCDRSMCSDHAGEAYYDVHYCSVHLPLWEAFVKEGGVEKALQNVVPFQMAKNRPILTHPRRYVKITRIV